MDESRSHKLDPAGFLANPAPLGSAAEWTGEIHLHSRLDERKVPGTHTDGDFPTKKIREHRAERVLKVRETDILVNHYSFHLIESVIVRRIDILVSEHPPGDEGFQGGSFGFHDDVLHARCLGGENIPFSFEPECILHVPRRMGCGNIDRIEIPILGRDLVGFVDIEPHAPERVLDLHEGSGDRMEMVPCVRRNRSGHILEFIREPLGDERFFYDRELFLKSGSHADLALVDGFPDRFLVLVGEVLDSFQEFGQRSVFPEDGVPEIDESGFGSEFRDLDERSLFEGLEVVEH